MTAVIATVLGVLSASIFALLLADLLAAPELQRENYRGVLVSTGGGLVSMLAALFTLAAVASVRQLSGSPTLFVGRSIAVLFVFVAFAVLGFVDDVLGNGDSRGFRGHLQALARGQVTTGLLKLGGGAAAAWIVADQAGISSFRVAAAAGVITLSANLCNLLDRAPARALKCGAVAWLSLLIVSVVVAQGNLAMESANRATLLVASICVGSCLGLLPFDAAERLMIGDAGANALGAVLGTVVVLTQSWRVQLVVLIVVAALNLLSEFVSFSSIIQRVRCFDWLDRFGTRRARSSTR